MFFQYPFHGNYPITQYFGEKITNPQGHTGIDFGLPMGTAVYAGANGIIESIRNEKKGYGLHVVIRHNTEWVSLYAHLSLALVREGQSVQAGDPIGKSGNTGNSTGAHLHFEVRLAGKPVDPLRWSRAETPPAEKRVWQVTCPVINIRSGPGLQYPIMGMRAQGVIMREQERQETIWVQVGIGRWAASIYQNQRLMTEITEQTSNLPEMNDKTIK